MALKRRSDGDPESREERRAKRVAKPGAAKPRAAKPPGGDPLSKLVNAVFAAAGEAYKLVREMAIIPWQAWMFCAEISGAAVLAAWRLIKPVLVAALKGLRWLVRLGQRHVTPARALAAVTLAALAALVASQWLDYRSVAVGTDAYSGGVEAIAPPPAVESERTGDAHGWVILPLALAGLVILALACLGRPKLARGLVAVGIAVIVLSLAIDAPSGLDEGDAAVAYEGAEATLLEGFWAQIASGSVLVFCGLVLPLYLRARPERATGKATAASERPSRRRLLPRKPRSASA
jgi:hypothetical protein